MNKTKLLPPLSKAELEELFAKIFKNYRIAFVGSDDIYEVRYDPQKRFWMKLRISRMLVSTQVFGYIIDRYLVVWKAHSDDVLLSMELDVVTSDTCLLSTGGYNFVLRDISGGLYTYKSFEWNDEKACYEVTDLGNHEPRGLRRPYESKNSHVWQRLYLEKEGVQCTDNTLYDDFIEKYRED